MIPTQLAAQPATMQLPLQITFRQMEPSPAIEARIRELAARLEKFSTHIMRCHVVVEPPAGHHSQGAPFEFHIDITLPEREVSIRRARPFDPAHEDPFVALRDAFRAARRRLQDYERRRRGGAKSHAGQDELVPGS
jgi:ribosome-associated translation inhibitor RaiA